MPYLTPYLPPAAKIEVQTHERMGKLVVHRILEGKENDACKNCAGEGVVYVSFLGSGPAKTPLTNLKPSTWVEKSERNGAGWYVIERTAGYPCPHCQGARSIPVAGAHRTPEVKQAVRELVGQHEISGSMPRGDE